MPGIGSYLVQAWGFIFENCPIGQVRFNAPSLFGDRKKFSRFFNVILETCVSPGNTLAETIDRARARIASGAGNLPKLISSCAPTSEGVL